ncbi:conserved hypothetical protein [Microbacterium sp. C448]|uniref:HEPN-associated N-terminal domain-containing protein n=1 Tax=Microbacterium lacus TaxID=415217 RepID=UPI0003DE2A43|nr:HEPN-associated N-terminal domain-containing protein [Microbacterium lacus]CDJ99377.1 conserved hypothetical protein [Microbacterium sp. C448]
MGGVQRLLDEIESRGWSDVGKTVCSACLTDYALSAAVRESGGRAPCDYCHNSPSHPEASASVNVVLDLIVDGFRYEYEDPVEQVVYSSADGGYQMGLLDPWDLLGNHEVTEDGRLFEDLATAIQQDAWVQRDPYAASPTDALRWGWEAFRQYVKHRRRYTFLVRDTTSMYGAGEITMDAIPAALADAVETAGQIRTLDAGTKWWRVRVHASGEHHRSATALGSPPDQWAKDNRMTAKGMGAFYGATTAVGAQAEVAGYAGPKDEGTIGAFKLLRDITVVDLTMVDEVPSLFDPDRRHERAPIAFMRDFVEDVARVADPSDRQNLDYVPTQIVAEYLRYELRGPAGPVDGILWRSSKDPAVTNCVVFAANERMTDAGHANADSLLELDPATVRVIAAPL